MRVSLCFVEVKTGKLEMMMELRWRSEQGSSEYPDGPDLTAASITKDTSGPTVLCCLDYCISHKSHGATVRGE